MKSFVNIYQHDDNIIHNYIEAGKRYKKVIPYQPILGYIVPKKTEWTDIYGNYLETRRFDSIKEANQWKRDNENLFDIYGDIRYTSAFITENYQYDIPLQHEGLHIYALDIEAYSESGGFCQTENDGDFINAITFLDMISRKSFVYGLKDYTPDTDNIVYHKCKNEEDLLECIIDFFSRKEIDIITGWYLAFDIPYIINRIIKLLGEKQAKRLSPVGKLRKSMKNMNKRQVEVYEIVGITEWDYLELYKKFTYDNKDSYTLDNISRLELGEAKIEYKHEYTSLNELYEKDSQLFYTYNQNDCELILLLDDKLKFIDIALNYAYMMKCPLDAIFGTVQPWDALLYYRLYINYKLCPPNKFEPEADYGGGYVKKPIKGMIDYVTVYDITSSYPNQTITFNLGPETIVPESYIKQYPELQEIRKNFYGVESCLDIEKLETIAPILRKHNINYTANGQFFRNDVNSFIADIVSEIFQKRLAIKKQIKEAKTKHEKELLESQSQILKIAINSNYGFLGCNYSRFFDIRIAEAITMQGQICSRGVGKYIENQNKLIKWVYQDTDSIFVELNQVVKKRFGDILPDTQTVLDFILKYQEKILAPSINEYFDRVGKALNVKSMTVHMEHECIADKSLFVEKKMYVMRQIYKDGVNLVETPKYKIKGLAIIKTAAYPEFTRNAMKRIVEIVFETNDNKRVIEEIEAFKKEFYKAELNKISTPISVNMTGNRVDKVTGEKYTIDLNLQSSGLPKQVRAALIHNEALKKLKLTKKYETIKSGNKIRFVHIKVPNIFQSDVIGYIEKIPNEFLKHIELDYNRQWKTMFMKPMKIILNTIGFDFEKKITLDSFFD